jgi:hypothetical protein
MILSSEGLPHHGPDRPPLPGDGEVDPADKLPPLSDLTPGEKGMNKKDVTPFPFKKRRQVKM